MDRFTLARALRPARGLGALVVSLLFSFGPVCHAANAVDIFGDANKDFTENAESPPPEPPLDANLASAYQSPINRFRFLIDKPSIALGKDGVVRFTLVAVSPEGVKNIVYEGMHCAGGTYKRYSYLTDTKWHATHNPEWHSVDERDGSGAQRPLFDKVFCSDGFPLNLTAVLDRLKESPFKDIPY